MRRSVRFLICAPLLAALLAWLPAGGKARQPDSEGAVLVFVHGAGAEPERFDWLATRLEEAGWARQHRFGYDSRAATIEEAACDLANFVEGIVDIAAGDRLVVVAHSMGGVISRFWVERMGGAERAAGMVLLAVPNRGSPALDTLRLMYEPGYLDSARLDGRPLSLRQRVVIGAMIATWRRKYGDGAILELCTDSPLIALLNSVPLPEGVHYLVAAGTSDGGLLSPYVFMNSMRERLGHPLPQPNDGMVPLSHALVPPELGATEEVLVEANHSSILSEAELFVTIADFLDTVARESQPAPAPSQ